VLADSDPYTTGGIGILGTAPSRAIVEKCDALLIVGSTFPYIEYYTKPDSARVVQIDSDPQRIGLRFPVEAGLVGDAKETLRLLNSRLTRKPERSFLEQAQSAMEDWRSNMALMENDENAPLKPAAFVRAFGQRIAQDGVMVAESGQNTELAARHIDLGIGDQFSVSGALASMASGLIQSCPSNKLASSHTPQKVRNPDELKQSTYLRPAAEPKLCNQQISTAVRLRT
jgi:pyruvate dehydrogenase (quinone)